MSAFRGSPSKLGDKLVLFIDDATGVTLDAGIGLKGVALDIGIGTKLLEGAFKLGVGAFIGVGRGSVVKGVFL